MIPRRSGDCAFSRYVLRSTQPGIAIGPAGDYFTFSGQPYNDHCRSNDLSECFSCHAQVYHTISIGEYDGKPVGLERYSGVGLDLERRTHSDAFKIQLRYWASGADRQLVSGGMAGCVGGRS